MEPMVIFSAGLVIYCSYVSLADALRDMRQGNATAKKRAATKRKRLVAGRHTIFSVPRRGDGGVARWPRPLTGSF